MSTAVQSGQSLDVSNKYAKGDTSEKEEEVEVNHGLFGTRMSTLFMIMIWIVCVVFKRINYNWSKVECYLDLDDDSSLDECEQNSGVFRIVSVGVFIFAVQGVISLFYIRVYDNYWIWKFLFFGGAVTGLLYADANFFDDKGFIWIARICAFIFIMFLSTVMLDFAYYWKEGWLDKSTATGRVANEVSDCAAVLRDVWKCALLAVSVLYIVVFIVTMAVLYHYFGGSDCSEGQAIITVSLVSTLCALVLQLFFTSNGSIIASGIIASYVAYLTYVAVSLNPDAHCNPTLSTRSLYGVGPRVVGLALSLTSILWVAVITSRRMASLMGSGGILSGGVVSVIAGSHSGAGKSDTKDELKKNLRTTVMNINAVYILICFYVAMTLSNWGTLSLRGDEASSSSGGHVSMWMQASGAWVVVALYVVGLLLPTFQILPRSIWDLQPKF